ncbi:MAG TPA: hypothetical protein ENK18_07100 [Deltaproteobacteria bacterium]|nr:hypothetical protein [Deltaproteobacteria bacterium]
MSRIRRPWVGGSARLGLATSVAAVAAAVSYILQRLASAWVGEPAWTDVIASAHVPYLWRLALAGLHGATAGTVTGLGLDEVTAVRGLALLPRLLPPLALALAAAAILVP